MGTAGVVRALNRTLAPVIVAGTALFAAVLAVTAFLGLFVRPISDDYCEAAKERDWGLLGIVRQYYFDFNGRIGNGIASGAVNVAGFGPKALPTLLALMLAGGLAGTAYLLFRRHLGVDRSRAVLGAAFLGVAVTATAMWDADNPYQVVLWAAGSLTHTLPWAVSAVLLAAAVATAPKWPVVAPVLAVVAGFVFATDSESYGAVASSIALVVVAYLLVHGPRRGTALNTAVATIVGCVVGLLVVVTSPGRAERARLVPSHLHAFAAVRRAGEILPTVLRRAFTVDLVLTAVAVGVLLALLLPHLVVPRRLVWWLTASCLALPFVAAFEVVTGLGMAYGPNGWGYSRAWEDFVVPSVLSFMVLGYVGTAAAAALLARRRPAVRPWLAIAAGSLATIAAAGGFAHQVKVVHHVSTPVVQRAVAFDRQEARIRAARAAGQRIVTFVELPIFDLADPYFLPAPRDWVGACASVYFRVDGIHRPGLAVRHASLRLLG